MENINNNYNYEGIQQYNFFELLFPRTQFPNLYPHTPDTKMDDLTQGFSKMNINLTTKTVKELKSIAKQNKIKGYSKLKKKELLDLLSSFDNLEL